MEDGGVWRCVGVYGGGQSVCCAGREMDGCGCVCLAWACGGGVVQVWGEVWEGGGVCAELCAWGRCVCRGAGVCVQVGELCGGAARVWLWVVWERGAGRSVCASPTTQSNG